MAPISNPHRVAKQLPPVLVSSLFSLSFSSEVELIVGRTVVSITGRGRPSNRRQVSSMLPEAFSSDFDVVSEIAYSRDQYVGGESHMSIHSFPSYLRTCIDRVISAVAEVASPRPGISVVFSASVPFGAAVISEDEDVKRLLEIKDAFHRVRGVDAEDVEELAPWFRSFAISIPDPSGVGNSRVNITVTNDCRSSISDLSTSLGISYSLMATLSLVITLSTQPCMLAERRELLSSVADEFFRRVKRRRKVAEVLLGTLKKE